MAELPSATSAGLSATATDDASVMNRPSPFKNQTVHAPRGVNKDANDNEHARFGSGLFIARTRSLDDTHKPIHHQHQHLRQHQYPHHLGDYSHYFMSDTDLCSDDPTTSTALHSSFDSSLLRVEKTLLEEDEDGSFAPVEVLPNRGCELSEKKHNLRSRNIVRCPQSNVNSSNIESQGTNFLGTSQTLQATKARRITSEQSFLPKTPGRLRHCPVGDGVSSDSFKPLINSPPPSSAVKRRRAASSQHPRPSPMRRVPSTKTTLSHSGTYLTSSDSVLSPTAIFGNNHLQQATPTSATTVLRPTTFNVGSSAASPFPLHHHHTSTNPSPFSSEHPTTMTPTNPINATSNSSTTVTGPLGTGKKKPYYTGTTAGTTPLGTTFETDSVETSSPARFCFTSFPASLPRINNLRTRDRQYPDSVRKRMSFGAEGTPATTRDDSNYAEIGTDGAPVNQSCEANQSRDDEGTHNTSISSLSAEGGHHQHLPEAPSATSHLAARGMMRATFPPSHDGHDLYNEGNDHFGYSDDDDDPNDGGMDGDKKRGSAGRTRLDFNVFVSPPDKHGSANKHVTKALEDGSTLLRPLDLNLELSRPYDQRRANSFPSSLSSTTQMNISSCDDMGGSLSPPRHGEKCSRPSTPREVQLRFPIESECSPIPDIKDDPIHVAMDRNQESSSSSSSLLVGDKLMPPKPAISVSGLSLCQTQKNLRKEEESTTSESTNAKQRRLRPMPDISAFENAVASSRIDRSADDSATADSRGPSTNRLLCPPTPQRTPAWANEGGVHNFFAHRQNSLITTKVLLSCPSQVLEGRSSLENSLLDDESRARDFSSGSKGGSGLPPHQPESVAMDIEQNHGSGDAASSTLSVMNKGTRVQISAPPRLTRRLPSGQNSDAVVSFADDFEVLGVLGSGAFADVYKVRCIRDGRLYAVKRNRRQFRGRRDRNMALAEVQSMQRLQNVCAATHSGNAIDCNTEKSSYSLYILFFYRAWQEEGYFYSQTELCCRDTCREMLDSIRFLWSTARTRYPSLRRNLLLVGNIDTSTNGSHNAERLVPNMTVWKICHDISAGLSHIHSHNIAHGDLKPSNIFFVSHPRFGAMCKIGDFGMAGSIGSSGDGQEGDARYMSSELLASAIRRASSDIFSLGLTLFEIAADDHIEMPSEGPRWHQLRSANELYLPPCRDDELQKLVQSMTNPNESIRPTADEILKHKKVKTAGLGVDAFLKEYIRDVEDFDRREEERLAMDQPEDQTPRNGQRSASVRSPSLSMLLAPAPNLLSPTVVNP